jgi:hypothetical protein
MWHIPTYTHTHTYTHMYITKHMYIHTQHIVSGTWLYMFVWQSQTLKKNPPTVNNLVKEEERKVYESILK